MTYEISTLERQLREMSTLLDREEARQLVKLYYDLQGYRIEAGNQAKAHEREEKPNALLLHFAAQFRTLERQMVLALDDYSTSTIVGRWSRSVKGIGPVIAAGLQAWLDIEKAPTAGHIWRYCGLDPTSKRVKGQKINYNPAVKVLCWKIGQSFVKVSGKEDAVYGQIYRQRKEYEQVKNEAGDYAEQAAAKLLTTRIQEPRIKGIYESGMLPPGHIDARCQRYATKMFLSHWHHVAYRAHFHEDPPVPYPVAHLGHAHILLPEIAPELLTSAV
jgi:hypothetical protein